MSARRYLRCSYIFPLIHLGVCAIAALAAVPGLNHLGITWTYLIRADFPWSLLTVFLLWKYGVLAELWIVIVGTSWWYFLGRLADYLLGRLVERLTSGRRSVQGLFK